MSEGGYKHSSVSGSLEDEPVIHVGQQGATVVSGDSRAVDFVLRDSAVSAEESDPVVAGGPNSAHEALASGGIDVIDQEDDELTREDLDAKAPFAGMQGFIIIFLVLILVCFGAYFFISRA